LAKQGIRKLLKVVKKIEVIIKMPIGHNRLKQGALYYVIELQRSAFFLLSRDFTFFSIFFQFTSSVNI